MQPFIDEPAALPVDVTIAVTNTCPDIASAGKSKSVAFSVTATMNADSVTGVHLDVSIPTTLQPSVISWICVNSVGTGRRC